VLPIAAIVYVPAKQADKVLEGRSQAAKANGVSFLRMEQECAVFEVESGKYQFRSEK